MTTETALPTGAESAAAGEQASTQAAATTDTTQQLAEGQHGAAEGADDEGGDKPARKEKTQEQREIERLRRRVDNLTRQKYELSARQPQDTQPAQRQQATQASTDEPVTLTKAQLDQLIAERAHELAPAVKEQQAEVERRQKVFSTLEKAWGKEEFAAKANELDGVFGGLADRSGSPKAATKAVLESDDPKAVIEYLTDPDNEEEAERFSQLSELHAGRAIARIEAKLEAAKKDAKPRPSNAPTPIGSVKGGGVPTGMPDPVKSPKAYIRWANQQEAGR